MVQISVVASLVGFAGALLLAPALPPRSPILLICLLATVQWPLGYIGWLFVRRAAPPGEEAFLRVRLERPGQSVVSIAPDGSESYGYGAYYRRYCVTFDHTGAGQETRRFAVQATLFSSPRLFKCDGNKGYPRQLI
ncbi:MAG: hypothetical protein U1C74_13720 [Phenylobacterium sp.]|nr:hypothetical protein [Phenylobacterium sp.]